MLLQNLYVPFSINGAFTDVQVTHDAMGTNTPPYHHRCWLLNFVLVTIWMVLFLFTRRPCFPQKHGRRGVVLSVRMIHLENVALRYRLMCHFNCSPQSEVQLSTVDSIL